jgi:predicted ABC-type ATPase
MIAGPNGSGKTTLTRYLIQEHGLSPGVYINADDIERKLGNEKALHLQEYSVTSPEPKAKEFFRQHPLNKQEFENRFDIQDGTLRVSGSTGGYFAAILADFLRRELLRSKLSFSFETVMSGHDKIELLEEAQKTGYRTYLYYICTEDVLINKERINSRILMGEHAVPEDKIVSRYTRSLDLLLSAIKASNRAYLFDNSGQSHELIAEVTEGNVVDLKKDSMPGWFIDAVLNKLDDA